MNLSVMQEAEGGGGGHVLGKYKNIFLKCLSQVCVTLGYDKAL